MMTPSNGLVLVEPYVDEGKSSVIVSSLQNLKRGKVVAGDGFSAGSVVVYSNGEPITIDKKQYFLVDSDFVRGTLARNADGEYPLVY